MNLIPSGMTRRHFMQHLAASASTIPAMQFISHMQAHAQTIKKNQKACILMWMGGGPPTIDIWDLKPGSKNGGEFKPISTKGDLQISEHMPKTAAQFDVLNVVRSMSTREADHGRGRYFMHTAFIPNPTVVHPTFGSVVSHELGEKRKDLEIPAFVSISGDPGSPGFMGMKNAAFVVDTNGRIRNAETDGVDENRLKQRLSVLGVIEDSFIATNRGDAPQAHKEVYRKAVDLMTSKQMDAFRIEKEKPEMVAKYCGTGGPMGGMANSTFGRGLLMARRLVESGVPFVEVGSGMGWDLHANVFNSLKDRNLPQMDTAIAGLVSDLKERGMINDVVLVWMGEFGRTPRINENVGRDHWAASWSVMIGGGGLKGGRAVGATDEDGQTCVTKSYLPGNIWATACTALGIPTTTVHASKNSRPMKVAGGEAPIPELIA